jgi:hypothetical protein
VLLVSEQAHGKRGIDEWLLKFHGQPSLSLMLDCSSAVYAEPAFDKGYLLLCLGSLSLFSLMIGVP